MSSAFRRCASSSGRRRAVLAHEAPHPLSVDGRPVATVYTPEREEGALRIQQQLLPALASLLAVAHERERLEREAFGAEALRRSDAIKTALIQAVSHDLRTPLATIEQALDGLESGVLALTEEDREQLLRTIRVEHTRLKRLVENLLDLSRLQAGAAGRSRSSGPRTSSWRRRWRSSPIPPRTGQYPARSAGCERQRRPDPARTGERARERTQGVAPGRARPHACQRDEAEPLIRVTDRGPGIPEEERERIFEPFHRVPGGPDQRGPGLGLAIARSFAEANGGRLWVESRPGQGASFVLALAAVELPVEVSDLTGQRVLVVDDEPQFLRALQTNLRGAGYDVATATTAAEAVSFRRPASSRGDHPRPSAAGRAEAPKCVESCGSGHRRPSSSSPRWARRPRRSPRSTPVRTTTSPSRSRSEELLARLRTVLRRVGPSTEPVLELGELVIDLEKRAVHRGRATRAPPPRTSSTSSRAPRCQRGKAPSAQDDPAGGLGPCLPARVELHPRLRLPAPTQARAGSRAAALHSDGARGGVPASEPRRAT